MKFTNVRESENGVSFDVETSKQECAYLVNYAVENLLREGIIAINSNEEDVPLQESVH
jgi:hypothetical protein